MAQAQEEKVGVSNTDTFNGYINHYGNNNHFGERIDVFDAANRELLLWISLVGDASTRRETTYLREGYQQSLGTKFLMDVGYIMADPAYIGLYFYQIQKVMGIPDDSSNYFEPIPGEKFEEELANGIIADLEAEVMMHSMFDNNEEAKEKEEEAIELKDIEMDAEEKEEEAIELKDIEMDEVKYIEEDMDQEIGDIEEREKSMVLKSSKSKLYKQYHGLDHNETNMNENESDGVVVTDVAMAEVLEWYHFLCC